MKYNFLWLIAGTLLLVACGPSPVQPKATALAPTETSTITLTPTGTPTLTSVPTPTDTYIPTLGIGSTLISSPDGMVMVYVPEGSFTMGYSGGYGDEQPQHTVTLEAFWIDRTEVTNSAYAECVQAGACHLPQRLTSNAIDNYYGNAKYADYPVIFVSWVNAQAYCTWAGLRLPSEAEWEKAARGTDGRLYPWGNNTPDKSLANFANNIEDVTRVGSYPDGASPYGVLDMAGNVWEWTADWYSQNYYSQSPDHNPPGPDTGTERILRGGSWNYDTPGIRSSYRLAKDPTFASSDTGLRCVRAAP